MDRSLVGLPRSSQAALQAVIDAYGLKIQRVTRRGPRFFVAEVTFQRRRAIWKMCVHPISKDVWSARKFSREIQWLDFLQSSRHSIARDFAPRLFASNLKLRPWYIREYIAGKEYPVSGNIRFKPEFFTTSNLRSLLKGFKDLQSIRPSELPIELRRTFKRYDTVVQWLKFLRPFWNDVSRNIGDSAAGHDLRMWLEQRQARFDRIPAALAHHEPYAPHFLRHAGRLRLIDWENINWANPVADATVLWMRANGHAAWQRALKRAWQARWKHLGNHFDFVWETDLVVRSIYTLLSAPTYKDQADIRPLARLAKQIVKDTLKHIRT